MKRPDTLLREYVNRLSDENLMFLDMRLKDRIGGDLAEAIDMLGTQPDMDRWFSSAKSCDEFYDMIDVVQEYINREVDKRMPELMSA